MIGKDRAAQIVIVFHERDFEDKADRGRAIGGDGRRGVHHPVIYLAVPIGRVGGHGRAEYPAAFD